VQKLGVVLGVRSHPRSSETSPFDRAHMTFYSTLIETICQGAIVRRYLRDPTFSRFDTIPECDGHTHTDRQTHDDGIYRA